MKSTLVTFFGICVEKNSEFPPGHPKRKVKGRVVFQGNRVTNQNWEAAIFQDLGSCPATMEASKADDFYGLIPGHAVEIADAEQPYIRTGVIDWHPMLDLFPSGGTYRKDGWLS